jgi:protoheme IX farnesyltransferase
VNTDFSHQSAASGVTRETVAETAEAASDRLPLKERLAAYFDLTKPRIAAWLHVAALASFYLASSAGISFGALFGMLSASLLQTAGVFALNHLLERHQDALMRRTATRPLPAGRLSAAEAAVFGIGATVLGTTLFFVLVNPLVGMLAAAVVILYLAVYTPLKMWTPYHTAPGAIAGAMPTLIGWAAATGSIEPTAWLLFGVVFFWQYPHFLSIDLMYREDYERAGMRVLPVVDRTGRKTALYIVANTVLMIGCSIAPTLIGAFGWASFGAALLMGALFLRSAVRAARERSRPAARALLIQTVLYLPLLLGFMVLEQLVMRVVF